MPRPPVKKTRVLAKAQRLGTLQAERQFHKGKPLEESLREHIGKIIDTITFRDIVDIVAAAGLTPIIHNAAGIISTVNDAIGLIGETGLGAWIGTMIFPGLGTIIGAIIGGGFGVMTGAPIFPKTQEVEQKVSQLSTPELLKWMLSFSIAWCIVKWGDKMINAGISGMAGVLGLIGL